MAFAHFQKIYVEDIRFELRFRATLAGTVDATIGKYCLWAGVTCCGPLVKNFTPSAHLN